MGLRTRGRRTRGRRDAGTRDAEKGLEDAINDNTRFCVEFVKYNFCCSRERCYMLEGLSADQRLMICSFPILPRELWVQNSFNAGGLLKPRGQPRRIFLLSCFPSNLLTSVPYPCLLQLRRSREYVCLPILPRELWVQVPTHYRLEIIIRSTCTFKE